METDTYYGIISVIPALLVIVMALVTKKTLLSLILGVYVGMFILGGYNPLTAIPMAISEAIIPSVSGNAGMLVLVAASGGFIFMIKSSGASQALASFAKRHIKSRKGAQVATWGAAWAFMYTEPHLTLGVIMRPITEAFQISRVKLAYMCDSLATIASISPVCAAAPFLAGLIGNEMGLLGVAGNEWTVYFRYIPYNFYAIFAILTVLIVALTGLDVGPMYEAEQRAIQTGRLIGPKDVPIIDENPEDMKVPEGAKITGWNIVVPMALLFVTLFAVIFWTGDIVANGFLQCFLNANLTLAITTAFFMGSVGTLIVAHISKVFSPGKALSKWEKGILDITSVSLILVFAWSLGTILNGLGIKAFMANLMETTGFPPALIPAAVFIIGALTSFSTGSSWGTWAIMIPIVFPLAVQFGLPPELVVAASVSGGLFGDHCSPISDTTIMSSTVAACDHVQHVRTQLPYGLTVAIASFCGFLVAGFTRMLLPGMLTTLVVLVAGIFVLNRIAKNHMEKGNLNFESEMA